MGKFKVLILIGLIFSIGCAGSIAWQSMKLQQTRNTAKTNNSNLMKLDVGMKAKEVVDIMGGPEKRESYEVDGDIIDFLFYRTGSWSIESMKDEEDQFTPLCLVNYVLKGWGRNFYQKKMEIIVKNK